MTADMALIPLAAAAPGASILSHPLPLFLLQAIVIIAVSRAIGWFARYVNQPMVIAEILAGIVLGPSILGLIAGYAQHLGLVEVNLQEALFPVASHETLGLVSQIGLVFFMFLVGLELEPRLLKAHGRRSLVIGLLSTLVPFGLSILLSLYLYDKVADPQRVNFLQFLLFLGVGMSITAFPVLARILAERQMIKSEVGMTTITSAAIADVLGWCLLAFIIAVVHTRGWSGAVWTTVLALSYIAFLLLVLRPFVGRLAATAASRSGLTQNIVAVAFILIMISSFATEWIGIHALFGAFLFGVIIPRENGYVKALVDKVEDFVVVFLLPLFFAFSGLRTEIGKLNSLYYWFLCLLIIAVATVGKFGGSLMAARLTGMRWRDATGLSVLMNTRGLMELVVLNIGFDLGIISAELFTMLVIMALVTTFCTTPILAWMYPRTRGAEQWVQTGVTEPGAVGKPALSMMICVAQERSGPGMANLAAALRGDDPAGSKFYALRLIRPPERSSAFINGDSEEGEGGNALIPLLHRSEELGLEVKSISFVSVAPAADICQVAAAKQVDLVLLGWHRPIFSQTALGGVVYEVMRDSPADVAVLVDRGLTRVKKVLFAFNSFRQDQPALRVIRRLQEHNDAEVVILHVISPAWAANDRRKKVRNEVIAGFPEEATRTGRVELKLVESFSPLAAALEEARRGYDLIVLGMDAEWGLTQRRFGFQPEEIIHASPVSLLIVQRGRRSTTPGTDVSVAPAPPPMPAGPGPVEPAGPPASPSAPPPAQPDPDSGINAPTL